jgi:amidohydrolase
MTIRTLNDIGAVIEAAVGSAEPRLIAIRRDIHAHPELGFEVQRTAGVVVEELQRLGLTCRTGVGRTGVVADIAGGAPGPCLLLRADMDALPIQEETGLDFASTVPGKMHACGHDLHTATLLGVAAVLKDLAPRLRGSIRLMFQPAEETSDSGAEAMVADGVLEGVDMALAFHNNPAMPLGRFGFNHGASTASADEFDILLRGKSGHAARPHDCVDPIVAAAALVTQLQTVVSRELNPAETAVLTVGRIMGGTTHNIIPESCSIGGTIRARSPAARTAAEAALRRIVEGTAMTLRVTCEVEFHHGVPPLMNDPAMLKSTLTAVRAQFGDVVDELQPGFGAEDFSYVSERVPSFHLRVGASQPGRNDRVHNAFYQPDEGCIGTGAAALARAAVEILS